MCLGDHQLVLGSESCPTRVLARATIKGSLLVLWRVCDFRWTLSSGDFWQGWGPTSPGAWRIPLGGLALYQPAVAQERGSGGPSLIRTTTEL